jgi:hypothetical protein
MTQTTKATKIVKIIATFRFNLIARICFKVASSAGDTTYHTCFNGSAEHASCTCPATSPRGCYHINQLRPVAQAYFESRKPAAPVVVPVSAEHRRNAPLNDNNRTFSLMR